MFTVEKIYEALKRPGLILLLDGVTVFVMSIFARQRRPATDFGPALWIAFIVSIPFWYAVLRFFDVIHQPHKAKTESELTLQAITTPLEKIRPELNQFMRIVLWVIISIVCAMMIMIHLEIAGSGH